MATKQDLITELSIDEDKYGKTLWAIGLPKETETLSPEEESQFRTVQSLITGGKAQDYKQARTLLKKMNQPATQPLDNNALVQYLDESTTATLESILQQIASLQNCTVKEALAAWMYALEQKIGQLSPEVIHAEIMKNEDDSAEGNDLPSRLGLLEAMKVKLQGQKALAGSSIS